MHHRAENRASAQLASKQPTQRSFPAHRRKRPGEVLGVHTKFPQETTEEQVPRMSSVEMRDRRVFLLSFGKSGNDSMFRSMIHSPKNRHHPANRKVAIRLFIRLFLFRADRKKWDDHLYRSKFRIDIGLGCGRHAVFRKTRIERNRIRSRIPALIGKYSRHQCSRKPGLKRARAEARAGVRRLFGYSRPPPPEV